MYVRVQSASIPIVQPNVNSTNNKLVLFYGTFLTLTATISVGNYTRGTDLATAMNATTTFGTTGMNELNNLIVPTGVAATTSRMLDLSGVRLKSVGESTTNLLISIPQSVAYGDILTYETGSSPFMSARRRNLSTITIQLLDENQNPYDTQGLPWSCSAPSMQFGRFLGRVAGFGARALPVVQRFGNAAGDYLHKESAIGARVAKLARSGLDAIEKSELGRIPGVGELVGVGRDATNFVGQSNELRGLTSQFERTANSRSG
ncbi:hypothetical protein T492DRAFT_847007 [Pavlovales sp. CCMP2436]|nr:hypothetical protein T492DRAFT_847007 [Pavlovales sp. CCMP2436]